MVGRIEVHYWAAARDMAGVEAESLPAGSLPDVLAAALTAHPRLVSVLRSCSVFVNGEQVAGAGPRAVAAHTGVTGDAAAGATARGDAAARIAPGSTVEILPPFAGG